MTGDSRRSAGSVAVWLSVSGADAADELVSLRDWLGGEVELRGRIAGIERPPPAGMLGPVLDALEVAVVPGGAVTVLASAVVAWVRHRTTNVTVRVERDGVMVEVDAKRVRELDAQGVRQVVDAVAHAASDREDGSGQVEAT